MNSVRQKDIPRNSAPENAFFVMYLPREKTRPLGIGIPKETGTAAADNPGVFQLST